MKFVTLKDRPDLRSEVIAMFFETSAVQNFSTPQAKRDFQATWLDYYIDKEPQNVIIATADDGKAMGYITGCFNSRSAADLYNRVATYKTFEHHYGEYPAHLHINVRAPYRSLGLGGKLLMELELKCRREGVRGLHLVTAEGNRNVNFYERYGFREVARAEIKGKAQVMLGKKLIPGGVG